MSRISGSGDKILADCGRARLWSGTRVLAVCIRVETFHFRGETSCACLCTSANYCTLVKALLRLANRRCAQVRY